MAFTWLKSVPGTGRVKNAGDPPGDHNAMSEALTETRSNLDILDSTRPLQGPPGIVMRGPWDTNVSYAQDDAVSYSGRTWYALQASTGITPPTTSTNSTYWGIVADRGSAGPAGAGASGVISPADLGYKAWTLDPAILTAGTRSTPPVGELVGGLIKLPSGTISNVTVLVGVAGVAVTNCYVALIDATSGTRLAVTADVSSTVQSTGAKRIPFVTPFTATESLAYVTILVGSATTVPQFAKNPDADTTFLNVRASGPIRSGRISGSAGLTSIPAGLDLSGSAAGNTGPWGAID